MIIWLFITFFLISILFLFYGASNDDAMTLTIGFAFLMLPAFALSGWDAPLIPDTPGIQYPAGANATTTYSYINVSNTTQIDTETAAEITIYETYKNHAFGSGLLLVAAFGLWFSITNIRNTEHEGKVPRMNWRRYK